MLLAQLVDMGFTLEVSRIAMIASGGTNLQEILEILIQQADSQPANRQNPPVDRQNPPIPPPHSSRPETIPPTRPSQPSNTNTSATPVPPVRPSSRNPVPPPPRNNKNSDDEGEDPSLEKEREAQFKKEQEERRKEYLEQLKREKPTPPTPSPRPPPKSPPKPTTTTTSDPATFFADKERKQGNFLFNKNQFPEAEAAYTLAIDALPPGHTELVLLSNNRAAARLKQNKYHECLSDCSVAIDVARKQMALHSSDTTWKSQMIKALHRKACALEGLRLYEAAIQVYEEYVRMDGSRSAQVSQGIIRCQQALLNNKKQPPPQPPRPANGPSWKPTNDMSAFPDIDFNMFIPKQTAEQKANLEEINKSKAVKEMRDREKKKEAEEAERLSKVDKVGAQISVWKTGKDRNLRALLGSLELILWPGVQWKGVTMGELLEPRKCKIAYMKAIAKVHPDKVCFCNVKV
jgi:tetratricopeptide (TPR) repeat protein